MMQIIAIVWAYRWHALLIAAVISASTAVFAKWLPKTYTATTTLMVSGQGNDPLIGGQSQSTPLFNYMSTEMQLMQSPEVLLPVVDKLNLTKNPSYVGGYSGDGRNLRDWAKEALAGSVTIELGPFSSQLIYVTAAARFPNLAADIANTVADVYLGQERQRISGPASERAARYAAELTELKDKVRLAQDQVTAFRQRTGVTDTATKNNNIEEALLASLQARLQDAQNARRDAEVKAMADQNLSTGAAGSLAIQNLKALLNEQQIQLAQLRTTLGLQHPKILELQSQISATQHNLDATLHSFSAGTSSDLTAARELEQKLRSAVEEQRAKVLGMNKLQDDGTKYEMELESAQSVYKRALEAYDQIMFASDAQVTNVNIVSRAVPPQKATKPNKVKLAFMGLLAGIGIGLLAPMIYELVLNRRLRCRDDFERDFSIPVLMEFDRIAFARKMP